MKRRKLSRVLATTLAVCMLAGGVLTGCGSKSDNVNNKTTQSGSTLIYGSNDYTRINPAIDEHGEINLLLFDGLTAHDENNEVVPGLAESWEEIDIRSFLHNGWRGNLLKKKQKEKKGEQINSCPTRTYVEFCNRHYKTGYILYVSESGRLYLIVSSEFPMHRHAGARSVFLAFLHCFR